MLEFLLQILVQNLPARSKKVGGQSFIQEVKDQLDAIDNVQANEDLSDCYSNIKLRMAHLYKKLEEKKCSNWNRVRLQSNRSSLWPVKDFYHFYLNWQKITLDTH